MNKKELKMKLQLTEEQYKKLIEVNELMNRYWNEENTIEQTLNTIIISDITESLNKRKEIYKEK